MGALSPARLLPGALLMLATAALVLVPALRPTALALVPAYPLAVLLTAVVLACRFRRLRVLLALGVLLATEQALAHFRPVAGAEARPVLLALGILVPLDLAVLALMRERTLARAPIALAVLGAQAVLVAALTHPGLASVARWLDASAGPWAAIPRMTALAFAVAAMLAGARFVQQPSAVHAGLLWTLVAAFVALSVDGALEATLFLTAGGLVLVVALVETSYGMAYLDELTGLPGRRALNEALAELRGDYAIAMVDIDHFKKFNDEHGHDVGDQLLRMVGARLARAGGGGRAFRYGGEEFAVLFPGQTVEGAVPHLEELRRSIEASGFVVRSARRPRRKPERPRPDNTGPRRRVSVTVSIGVAGPAVERASPEAVIQAADAALYRAKRAGRNRLRT